MQKKAIWAVLGTMLAMMVVSIALVFTVGPRISADSEEIPVVPVEYLNLTNDGTILGDDSSQNRNAFTTDGKTWIASHVQYCVEIPSSVTSISNYAFNSCDGLTSVTIPSSVMSIGSSAFSNCKNLTSIEIPSSVISIGTYAFKNCSNLISVEILSQITRIGEYTFSGCKELTSINIPSSVMSIGSSAFSDCKNLTSIEIPSSVTSIGDDVFFQCSNLTSVKLPSNLPTIGYRLFCDCGKLASIEIPSSVTSIGSIAFHNCFSLSLIEIPSSVISIGWNAFYNWTSNQTIHCEIESEPSGWSGWLNGSYAHVEWGNVPVYTVNFDTDGGSEIDSQKVIDGEFVYSSLLNTEKENYNLAGWSLNGEPYDLNTSVTANIMLTARWEICHHWVNFDSNGGSEVESQYVAYGETATEPTAPILEGYHFVKWYRMVREEWGRGEWREYEEDFDFDEPITEEITLYAKWAINLYTITFETIGGTLIDSQVVSHGEIAVQPDDPEKTGHIFKGWYTDNTYSTEYDFDNAVVSNLRIYAKWQAETYTVTLMDGDSKIEDKVVNYGTLVVPLDEPTKVGHNFIGWYLDSAYETAFNIETPIIADTTLYAKWSVGKYMVNFMTDGGSLVDSQTVVYEGYATRPVEDPTKVGHTFAGWYANEALTEEFDFTSTPIVANTEIYAKWEAISYTVTFEVNGTIVDTESVKYGSLVDAPAVQPVKGYPFVGWYNTATNKIFDVETLSITGDLNLRATWGVFFVDFVTNGGTKVQSLAVNENSKLEKPENPTQKGYTFAGWYTDESLTNEYDFDNAVTENMTLYAKWTEVTAEESTTEENISTVTNANKNNIGLIAGITGSVAAAIATAVTVAIVLVLKKRR